MRNLFARETQNKWIKEDKAFGLLAPHLRKKDDQCHYIQNFGLQKMYNQTWACVLCVSLVTVFVFSHPFRILWPRLGETE